MPKGIFTVSLDFELLWGVRDRRTIESYGANIEAVHEVVPKLLERFTAYGVHATWATVGFLFARDKDDLLQHLPDTLPAYSNAALSPYPCLQDNTPLLPVYHFAPELIALISATGGQEIATHTHAHFYTLEEGASLEAFDADLRAAIKLADERGYKLSSIIFPRNQYSPAHLAICSKHDINCYRGTESSWIYETRSRATETKLRRALRLLDAYINITGRHGATAVKEGTMVNIPSSRFLRPYSKRLSMFEGLRLLRMKNEMTHAAKHGLTYHLWWHPHNFGGKPEANFAALEVLLKHYKSLQQRYGMQSLNMNEIYAQTI